MTAPAQTKTCGCGVTYQDDPGGRINHQQTQLHRPTEYYDPSRR